MDVFYNTNFIGHYPVPVAAVVVADNEEEAAKLLNESLIEHGLEKTAKAKDFVRIPLENGVVRVLSDGDY